MYFSNNLTQNILEYYCKATNNILITQFMQIAGVGDNEQILLFIQNNILDLFTSSDEINQITLYSNYLIITSQNTSFFINDLFNNTCDYTFHPTFDFLVQLNQYLYKYDNYFINISNYILSKFQNTEILEEIQIQKQQYYIHKHELLTNSENHKQIPHKQVVNNQISSIEQIKLYLIKMNIALNYSNLSKQQAIDHIDKENKQKVKQISKVQQQIDLKTQKDIINSQKIIKQLQQKE